ncbi:MAG: hypothetical protein MUE43_13215 [Serpentinimonas sp.]|jgi:hypothetical protein|nr:hypothetical protein [Serpentinimonas sp.]
MSSQSQQALLQFSLADAPPQHQVDTTEVQDPQPPSETVHALARLRGRLLQALSNEDFRTVKQELPGYQELLQQVVQQGSMNPERLSRLEAEHQRFHEQLRATLLTTRITLRLELERVRAAQQYITNESAADAIDLRG